MASSPPRRTRSRRAGVAAARVGERGVGERRRRRAGCARDGAGVAARERLQPVEQRGEAREVALDARAHALAGRVPCRSAARLARRLVSGVRSSWPASAVKRRRARGRAEASRRASIAFSECATSSTSADAGVRDARGAGRASLLTAAAPSRSRPSGRRRERGEDAHGDARRRPGRAAKASAIVRRSVARSGPRPRPARPETTSRPSRRGRTVRTSDAPALAARRSVTVETPLRRRDRDAREAPRSS